MSGTEKEKIETLFRELMDRERDAFWQEQEIPFQTEDETLEFANATVVQRKFLELNQAMNVLAEKAEVLSLQIARLEHEKGVAEREQQRMHVQILRGCQDRLPASTTVLKQLAFIRANASPDEDVRLEALETRIEELTTKISRREPLLKLLKDRLKALEKLSDNAKQYLDFEKMLIRMVPRGGYGQ